MQARRAKAAAAWLEWQFEAGVDICVADPRAPRSAEPPRTAVAEPVSAPVGKADGAPIARPAIPAASEALRGARTLAASCRTLEELRDALERFEACPLRATATRLCLADGAVGARLMLIGEAPGAEEDRQGVPFVGASGKLLDRILACAGLDRQGVYITNAIFWRPPGNRSPTTSEIALCQPFLERQIEIVAPAMVLFLGGVGARTLLGLSEGVTRLRNRSYALRLAGGPQSIPARVTFHPAYLLRQPLQKRLVWRDMLQVKADLSAAGVAVNALVTMSMSSGRGDAPGGHEID